MPEVRISLDDAEALAMAALIGAGASTANAHSTAYALLSAEIDGQSGHGLSRIPSYAAQVRAGKVDGRAEPRATRSAAALSIDAANGFAYPALDLAVAMLAPLARETGVAAAGVHRSHHIGQAGRAVEQLADQGLVALIVSNTPKAMAFHGGARPTLGTNPLAFAAPLPGRAPLLIDLALSHVARSKVIAAQRAGQTIPADWATDAEGRPTTDAAEALKGALAPTGGAKGAALALMVEVLCAALVGGHYGWEASSFLDDQGPPPGVGQFLLALDPMAFAGPGFLLRMGDLVAAMQGEDGVRLPGDRRLIARDRAAAAGIAIAEGLKAELAALAEAAA